jgi:hypothetical protein
VDTLNTLTDFKNMIRQTEQILPVPGYLFINKFEADILPAALSASLCGLPSDANDSVLNKAFEQETNSNDKTSEQVIERKINNWKKRNEKSDKLLLDLYHAFSGTQIPYVDIKNETMPIFKKAIYNYNMMIQGVKPLAFNSKNIYDEFISDLISYAKRKISKFKITIKGTGTAFYSENPGKLHHYFDKEKMGKSDIDIMIEPDKSIIVDFVKNNEDFDPSSNNIMKNKQYSRTSTFGILELGEFYDKWGIFEEPYLTYLIWKKPIYDSYKYLNGQKGHTGKLNREVNVNIMKSYDYYEESVHCHLEFVHEYP